MPITGIPPVNAGAIAGVTTTVSQREFLQLLVAQLRNQDPLSPMNDREFIAQMAQLSTLEATSGLALELQQMVLAQQQTQALQMVGRDVEYRDATGTARQGRVGAVLLDRGVPVLVIEEREVPLFAVLKVV